MATPSNAIETAYINNFRAGFASAYQQSTSRFRPYVEIESQAAEFDYYDRIGVADPMQEVNTRYGVNPFNEVPHDRRRIGMKDWDWGKAIDEKDLIRVATDPTNAYTQAGVMSANRKIDEIIMNLMFAPAYTGKGGEKVINYVPTTPGKVSVGQVSNSAGFIKTDAMFELVPGDVEGIDVAVDYTAPGASIAPVTNPNGLTIAKLKAIREAMMGTYAITQDTVVPLFVGRRQWSDLISTPEVANSLFALRKALAEGTLTSYLGFDFHIVENLPFDPATGIRQCVAFQPKAFKLAIGRDMGADMWRLPERKMIPYIYIKMTMGGSRMWGEAMCRVNCQET
jgi:hypothetical protein